MADFDQANLLVADDVDFDDELPDAEEQIHAPPEIEWFHGCLSRDEATKLLQPTAPGTYLLRESIRHKGDYSISFKAPSGVKHFQIISHSYGGFFLADNAFQSLGDVVEFYCNHFLCDNLRLTTPLRPETPVQAQNARKVVMATADYQAMTPDELSFLNGDKMTVVNDEDHHWLWCVRSGVQQAGFVPRSLVVACGVEESEREAAANCQLPPQFQRSRWLHGRISREETIDYLQGQPVGSFLIRESSNPYSLSIKLGPDKIKHMRIEASDQSRYTCGERHFDCLEAIVLRYINTPIMDDIELRYAVPPQALDADMDGDLYSDVQYSRVGAGNTAPAPTTAPPKPVSALDAGRLQGRSLPGGYEKMGEITRKVKRSKKWKTMYFALQSAKSRLFCFETKDAIKPKGIIDLRSSYLTTVDDSLFGRPNCFQIVVNGSEVHLCTDTPQERDSWLEALYEHCAECGVGRPMVDPTTKHTIATLSVKIMDTKDLPVKSGSVVFVASLNGSKHARTRAKPVKDNAAFFDEGFEVNNISTVVQDLRLELVPTGLRKGTIGALSIVLSSLRGTPPREEWYTLSSDGKPAGRVRVKLSLADEVILPVKAYEPLKLELERKDMVLQSALAEHLRASLNAFANHLIRIWINDGRDEELIGYLMAHHMQTEESPGTLFRGNTLVTKVMDQYMKFIAIDYLQDTVEHCIVDICDEKRSFEMDDSRGGRPAESARILKTHCQNICNSIFASVDRCPPPLRRVFGVLQQQAKKRFPGDAHVQYTSVSAFLFLRLFCPAIINPKLFNMMSEHPTDTLARNLTLVAKVIQNLANMAEFGQKEAFMQPMNEFIMLNRGKMQTFLNSVSSSTRGEHEVKVASASRDLAAVARMCSQTDKLETVLDSYKVQSPLVSIIRALESKNNA